MPDWTDEWDDDLNADETEARRNRDRRRVLFGTIAGVAMLVGPIVLANAVVPEDGSSDVEAEEQSPSSIVALRREAALHSDLARASTAQALRTTTTPPPPPPETTTTLPPETTTTTEAPPTTEATELPPSSGEFGDPFNYETWDALADCESGGNWSINTGNGYYGGLQFSAQTWRAIGGTGLPHEHSRETQIEMGIVLQQRSGWGQWPACSRELGLR